MKITFFLSSKAENIFRGASGGKWLALWMSIVGIYETPVELAFCFAEGMMRRPSI